MNLWTMTPDEVRRAIRRGAIDILAPDEMQRNVVMQIIPFDPSLELVVSVIPGASNIDDCDVNGWTALHLAASVGRSDVVGELIDRGASLNMLDSHGNTPLWRAVFATSGGPVTIARLLRAGANPRIKNHADQSVIDLVASMGGAGEIKALF